MRADYLNSHHMNYFFDIGLLIRSRSSMIATEPQKTLLASRRRRARRPPRGPHCTHTSHERPRRHALLTLLPTYPHTMPHTYFMHPQHGRTGYRGGRARGSPARPTPPRSTARVAWDPYPRISPTRRPAWMSIFRRPAPACPMRQTMLEPANINPCEHQPPTAAHCLAPW